MEGYEFTPAVREAVESTRQTFGQGLDFVGNLAKEISVEGARTIKRTADTIALYMPDTLNFGYDQGYDGASLSSPFFDILGAGKDILSAG